MLAAAVTLAAAGCYDDPRDKVADMVCATDQNCPVGYVCRLPGVKGGCRGTDGPKIDGGSPEAVPAQDTGGHEAAQAWEAGRRDDGPSPIDVANSTGEVATDTAVLDAVHDVPQATTDAPTDFSATPDLVSDLRPDALTPDLASPDAVPDTLATSDAPTACPCPTNFACQGNACVRVPESDCLDGADNNGDGLADCADPICNAQVMCTGAVAAGNEIGLVTTGACEGGYGAMAVIHQGLLAPPCTGCACGSPSTTCSVEATLNGGGIGQQMTTPLRSGECTPIIGLGGYPAYNAVSIDFSAETIATTACPSTGTPSLPPTNWTTTSNFCSTAAISKAGCGAGQVCVPRPAAPSRLCVRVPAADALCPSGYGAITSQTWFSGVRDERSCGSCSCLAAGGACDSVGRVDAHQTGGTTCVQSSCLFSSCANSAQVKSSGSVNYNLGSGYAVGALYYWPMTNTAGTCTPEVTTTGQATPTGASTICCQ